MSSPLLSPSLSVHSVDTTQRRSGARLIATIITYFLVICHIPPTQEIELNVKQWGSSLMSKSCSALGWECCRSPFLIPPDQAISRLKERMDTTLYGQHLAANIVLNALKSHLNDEDSKKALVLSFHGWAGSGKTFMAELIMDSLYQEGAESKFVKFYMASYHFPDPNASRILEYQEKVREDIMATVFRCERALFVFDEVDKTPTKLFDALVPFIQHPGKKFEGLNFKKAIFIFLSNIGSSDITKITYKNWKDGNRREDLRFTDFESSLQNEAFNKKDTGLTKSRVIDQVLVDFFVPFLPMAREHIVACARTEIEKIGAAVNPEKIADSLSYWPPLERLYSQTGCKKVANLVKFYDAEENFDEDTKTPSEDIREEL